MPAPLRPYADDAVGLSGSTAKKTGNLSRLPLVKWVMLSACWWLIVAYQGVDIHPFDDVSSLMGKLARHNNQSIVQLHISPGVEGAIRD